MRAPFLPPNVEFVVDHIRRHEPLAALLIHRDIRPCPSGIAWEFTGSYPRGDQSRHYVRVHGHAAIIPYAGIQVLLQRARHWEDLPPLVPGTSPGQENVDIFQQVFRKIIHQVVLRPRFDVTRRCNVRPALDSNRPTRRIAGFEPKHAAPGSMEGAHV